MVMAWDVGEDFTDWDNDGSWDGPEMVKVRDRDNSYWLEPEMYEDYEPFLDYISIRLQFVPGNSQAPSNIPWDSDNIYYYMPILKAMYGKRVVHLVVTIIFTQILELRQTKLELI